MIRNIVFGGCSYTWGQSLHLFNQSDVDGDAPSSNGFDENSVRSWEYQNNVDRRFATIVADYFGRKAKVHTHNGGSTWSIYNHVMKSIDEFTDLVVIQTTNFTRNVVDGQKLTIEKQVSMFEELLTYCNSKNIPVRFLHWDWPFDIVKMPNAIKDRSMKFDNEYTFFEWTIDGSEYVVDEFDNHFNYKTHKLIAKRIIENIEELGLLTQPNYD